jgi:hypothetical protein
MTRKVTSRPQGTRIPYGWEEIPRYVRITTEMFGRDLSPWGKGTWVPVRRRRGLDGCMPERVANWRIIRKIKGDEE